MTAFQINNLIVHVLLAVVGFSYVASPNIVKSDRFNNQLIIFFSVLFFILFGSRAFSVGTDTHAYIRMFQGVWHMPDIGFNLFADFVRLVTNSERFFLYAISFIFMLPICLFMCKIKYENNFLFFLLFVYMFFFGSLGINGLRQGIGISFLLLAIFYLDQRKNISAGILFFVSISFHYSMVIPISLYMISKKLKTITVPLLCFFVATVLSIMAFNFTGFLRSIPVLGSLPFFMDRVVDLEQFGARMEEGYFRVGFRLDFFIFNSFFAAMGLYFYKSASIKFISQYRVYLSIYLFTSAVFFLMFQLPFSNRFGLFSWIFIPFIMLPLIQKTGMFEKFGKIFALVLVIATHILLA